MKVLWSILLAALAGLALTACSPAEDPPLCGGVTDRTDHNAPKVIASKEITELSASFWLDGEAPPSHAGRRWNLRAFTDSSGRLILEAEEGARTEAEPALLAEMQALIERFELVKLNGRDRVTSGLAPAYSPMRLAVDYASGERLYFQMNGDPKAGWPRALLDMFSKAFSRIR